MLNFERFLASMGRNITSCKKAFFTDVHKLEHIKVAWSDFWVTMLFNFERLRHHHYQPHRNQENVGKQSHVLWIYDIHKFTMA